jgi:hypothetical protein
MLIILALLGGSILLVRAAYRRYRHTVGQLVGSLGLDLLGSTFVGMGMSLPALVLFFLTWMQNSERRRWIISGPYPLDRLGSGPLQVWIGVLGVVVGCILLSLGLIIRTYAFSSDSRSNHTHS